MNARYWIGLLSAFALHGAAAQTNLAGTWQGTLQVAPNTALAIHFVITEQPGGTYSAVVTSPDSGAIKDVRASGVTFTGNRLDIEVDALSGGYTGVLANGVIEGEWSQEDSTLPLALRPFTAPVLSQAAIDTLRGDWVGKLQIPGVELRMVFRFTVDAAGKLTGVFLSPDQGSASTPATDIVLENGEFSAKVPAGAAEFKGRLQGDEISGEWRQGGSALPLVVKKGEFVAAARFLELPEAARTQIAGRWRGTLGPLTLVVRFETDDQGRTLGFVDSPNQNANDIPITAATFADGRLSFTLASLRAEFSGDVAGNSIAGTWTQVGMSNPLTLTRE